MSFKDDEERFLTVSSVHVTPDDFMLITSKVSLGLMMFFNYETTVDAGVIIYVSYLKACNFDKVYLADLTFSNYFLDLIDWALANNIDWLRIVGHGTEIEGLPQYSWE